MLSISSYWRHQRAKTYCTFFPSFSPRPVSSLPFLGSVHTFPRLLCSFMSLISPLQGSLKTVDQMLNSSVASVRTRRRNLSRSLVGAFGDVTPFKTGKQNFLNGRTNFFPFEKSHYPSFLSLFCSNQSTRQTDPVSVSFKYFVLPSNPNDKTEYDREKEPNEANPTTQVHFQNTN